MKKVTAFVGSGHRKNTYYAVVQFLNKLKQLGDVECEIVTLSDYRLGFCRGCRLCFEKGEAFCPLKDDRDVLFAKIAASDGVIFATPNYCFQLSGVMKAFLDRFGFAIHRPCYFGKAFTSIVAQGFGGGDKIVGYFDFVATIMGFNTVKGTTLTGFDPRTEKQERKFERALEAQSKRFYALLERPANAAPSLYQVLSFRLGRTTVKQLSDKTSLDYRYYAERGWLESSYYYPTRLNVIQRAAGNLMDAMISTLRSMI